MTSDAQTGAGTTTTADDPQGVLLRVRRDEGYWMVTDVVGLRYGHGETMLEALTEWDFQVTDLLTTTDELADPLKAEVARYRKALS